MIRTYITSLFLGLLLAPTLFAQVTADVNDDGFIVLSGNEELLGVEFTSAAGLLSTTGDADPFAFFLAEGPEKITFGALSAVTIAGDVILNAQYSGDLKDGDLEGTWGGIEDGDPLPIRFPTMPPSDGGGTNPDPVIPEPSTGVLALLGLLVSGCVRTSRNTKK